MSLKNTVAIVFVVLAILFPLHSLFEKTMEHVEQRLFIGTYANFSSFETTEGSFTKSQLDIDNPWSTRNILIQILRAPFSPSPLHIFLNLNFPSLIFSLIGTTQYFLFPFFIIALIVLWRQGIWRQGSVLTVVIPHIAIFVTISFSLMLDLTIDRHIVPQFATLYILASQGIEKWKRYKWILFIWIIAALLVSVIYIKTR